MQKCLSIWNRGRNCNTDPVGLRINANQDAPYFSFIQLAVVLKNHVGAIGSLSTTHLVMYFRSVTNVTSR
jgi:hypothetical protein